VVGGAEKSRTFLLTELARALEDSRLAAEASDPNTDALVALVDAHRRAHEGLPSSIADPVGVSDRRFLEIFQEIDRLVTVVAKNLVTASIESPG
jgi:hypothetical protein